MDRTKKNKKKYANYLFAMINGIMVLIFTWILLLLCLGRKTTYACKVEWKVGNIILLLFGIGCICLIKKIPIRFFDMISNNRKVVLSVALLFFLVQVYIFYCIYFETGWDSGEKVIPAVRALLTKEEIPTLSYFEIYPNNLFLVHFYYVILKISSKIGIFTGTYQLMPIIICNCLISSLSCLMVYFIGEKRVSPRVTWGCYLWMLFIVGLSPWNVICYSDAVALFFPICIVYVYMNMTLNRYLKYGIIFILGYVGYCIKPQVAIVIIAIIIMEIIRFIQEKNKRHAIKFAKIFFISCCIVCLFSVGLQRVYQNNGFVKNKDREFGISHFFMMGLNEEFNGIFYEEDVRMSSECMTSAERREKNIEIAKERLKNYGCVGYLKFLSKKMLTNYNDGTFAWGVEGSFYKTIPDNPKARLTYQFRNVYYNSGTCYKYFSTMEQFLWITMIGAVWYMAMKELIARNMNYNILLVKLSIIGITVFELLFEARARYLYLYVPLYAIFVLLGSRVKAE